MSQQVDLSLEEQKILAEKTQRRAALRNEYLKLKSDPFRHATGEGGAVFDSAIQRYSAMKVNGFDYFKPSIKNGLQGLFLLVIPMGGFGYLVYKSRAEQEARFRNGEVAYKDRRFKLI
ncbi:unnamed protein product [Brassicogethes aeneus]|uniref:NADH dehydrogenase [ubiquinone] 1 beta subcomplex subunit 4 n=1 Tax=Brassicogethes aeneus TaxID=1431903 RepID=A0A9P0B203_BRAAE|nr:unnamed protein product [Brassicogethes aeneus]